MNNLLYKEFKLTISPFFFLSLLFGALILIPSWLYFVAMSYVFFITINNIFTASKSQNDIGFSVMLPVKKSDIVKSRISAIIIIELLHIVVAVGFAILNRKLYPQGGFFLEPNAAFFGLVFVMYAIFNSIFFTMFYKTANKILIPTLVAILPAVLFATCVEFSIHLVPTLNAALDSTQPDMLIWKLLTLALGLIIFVISSILTYKNSAKRFEKLDI